MGAAVVILLFCSHFQPAAQAKPRPHFEITSLGTLPGGDEVVPFDMNNHGDVVGRAVNSNGVFRAFVFRDGVMSELPIARPRNAFYINDAGDIVAQIEVNRRYQAYLITAGGVVELVAETNLSIWPVGINNSGVVGGYITRGLVPEAVTWSNGLVRFLGFIDPARGSVAHDINNPGEVLSTFYLDTPPGPAVVTAIMHDGLISILGTFAGRALNDHGHIAGQIGFGHPFAFLYRPGASLPLDPLPGDYYSYATEINNADEVIGHSEDGEDHLRPVLYTDGLTYDLNDLIRPNSGWTLFVAADINDRGQITGWGLFHGEYRGFLLTPKKQKQPRAIQSPAVFNQNQ